MTQRTELIQRITDYLATGGLFNPELMDHARVKMLLMDVREYLTCEHRNAWKSENLVGEGAMEYVQWYDNYCPDCGKVWTTNE